MTNPFDEIVARLERIESLMLSQDTRKPEPIQPIQPEMDKPMNVSQAADFLGTTSGAVYQLHHQRKIPCAKRGGRLFFFEKELRLWIKSARLQTVQEIQNEAIKSLANTTK